MQNLFSESLNPMHHVQHFRANFDQPTKDELVIDSQRADTADGLQTHEDESQVRNVCFVWEDGRKAFFNYAYLVAGDLSVQDGINALVLSFGSYTVLLKGYNLASLFDALLEHSPKIITAINPRYLTQQESQNCTVVEIIVKNES